MPRPRLINKPSPNHAGNFTSIPRPGFEGATSSPLSNRSPDVGSEENLKWESRSSQRTFFCANAKWSPAATESCRSPMHPTSVGYPVDSELDVLTHRIADCLDTFHIGFPIPADFDLECAEPDSRPATGAVDRGVRSHDPDRHVGHHPVPAPAEIGIQRHACRLRR